MSSSITFAFQLLADYPEVLAKVREEQTRVRAGDFESPLSLSLLEQMPYTNAVVKETLRYRPPVLMVPYLAKKEFKITDDYVVPKGTMIIPSFWNVRQLGRWSLQTESLPRVGNTRQLTPARRAVFARPRSLPGPRRVPPRALVAWWGQCGRYGLEELARFRRGGSPMHR